MPLFGAHLSVAGGLHQALLAARDYGMDTVQMFTASPQMWKAKPIDDDQARLFRSTLRQTKLRSPIVHDSYLINLASPKEDLYRRSVEAFVAELDRCEAIGARYLVTHPGAHLDDTEDEGLMRVAKALDEVHALRPDHRVRVLLENTAGQGTCLGHRFEHLARILSLVAQPERLGVCFDTCHAFAAGYALSPEPEYQATMRHLGRVVGLKRVRVFHVNDSLKAFGSRVDRHAHLGKGEMGLEPFRLLVNDARFRDRPMVLETPKEDGAEKEMDAVNLAVLRKLGEASEPARTAAG